MICLKHLINGENSYEFKFSITTENLIFKEIDFEILDEIGLTLDDLSYAESVMLNSVNERRLCFDFKVYFEEDAKKIIDLCGVDLNETFCKAS